MSVIMNAPKKPELAVESILEWLRARVVEGAHLRLDARDIRPGDVFVACPGYASDGRLYIEQALSLGAGAVLFEGPSMQVTAAHLASPLVLEVEGLRPILGQLADHWYGQPSAALSVVAVTGTNGKTSCVQWIAQALTRMGKPCGTIGTLGALLPSGASLGGHLTTPDVLTVHRTLAAMRDAGAQCVAMEASSIGIDQGRLDAVRVSIAGFTNLTRDHLDYHGTMDAYEQAKLRLFEWPGLISAVVNADDPVGRGLLSHLPQELTVAYSVEDDEQTGLRARDVKATAHGQVFTLVTPTDEAQIVTQLLGLHNVSNLLLVAGVLHGLGLSLSAIARELAATQPVDGRLQSVAPVALPNSNSARGPLVVVDYAHTPDALVRALTALQPVVQARGGKLRCLFGCGGERDPGKRPEMACIAVELADTVMVTSDNPRSESPDAIIEQIVAGVSTDASVGVQPDRALAIMQSVWASAPEDVLLLAGKGHETYQEIDGKKLPFDDRQWARLALLLPSVPGVSSDTRKIGAGELFVALVGENFDAHDYLAQAEQAGACATVVAHPVDGVSLPQLVLGDTRRALMRIGAAWRAQFVLPVVAVVGSNGKTTTKEMVSAIFSDWQGDAGCLATVGNFNNDIGVPLTLLRLRPEHRAAVFELGMNHPGEIATLAEMAAPTVALVTNAQREHQEFMHSVEAVALENGAVISALPADGIAVYPGDDPYTYIWDVLAGERQVLRFGLTANLEVHADQIQSDTQGTRCVVITPQGEAELMLPVPGLHNLRNALAAIAAALAVGTPLSSAVRGLPSFSAVAGRMQRNLLSDGTLLIDDTYNANPDSARAAIDVLARLPHPQVLVLGDMGEVGDNGPATHAEVGNYAREQGIDALVTLGDASKVTASEFGERAVVCMSVQEVLDALQTLQSASVLVKGSRFMRMERVVAAFSNRDGITTTVKGDQHVA
jgi:MurE/MurF fusion protein